MSFIGFEILKRVGFCLILCVCERRVGQGNVRVCVCVGVEVGWYFCTFLLVKLMSAVVSRYGLWNDVKLSVIG